MQIPMSPPMGMPPGMPMGAVPPPMMQSPAGMIAPQVTDLATQQDAQMAAMHQQMRDQVVKLLTMLPTYNPAGAAARSQPLSPIPGVPNQPQAPADPNAQGGIY